MISITKIWLKTCQALVKSVYSKDIHHKETFISWKHLVPGVIDSSVRCLIAVSGLLCSFHGSGEQWPAIGSLLSFFVQTERLSDVSSVKYWHHHFFAHTLRLPAHPDWCSHLIILKALSVYSSLHRTKKINFSCKSYKWQKVCFK